MKSKKSIYFLIFLSALSFFIPLLLLIHIWFADGSVIVGHDSGFSLNARYDLQKKSLTWWEDGFGSDATYYISSQFIHAIDLASAKLAGIEGGGNGYVVFFWFFMMFFAMLPLSLYIAKKINNPYIIVFLPIFYVFNFFVFQSIFIFERTKYSLLVSLPLFLYFSFLVRDKKIPIQIAAVLTSITLFFFNGGGWVGAPLYGGILLAGMTFVIFILIEAIFIRKFELLKRIVAFFVLSVILTVLLDAYSLLPAVYDQMFSNESPLANIGGWQGWIGMVSIGASFLNLFRMQGIPDWYSNFFTTNPDHPYGPLYLTNSFLIFLSFLIPIITFLALLFAKKNDEKQYVYFFALLALISMAFTSGSHTPLGWLYIYLYEHMPLFWLFRSPFYKFAPSYIFSISFLLSFTLSLFISKIASRIKGEAWERYSGILLCVLIVFSWFSFHFVFFNRSIFSTWQKGFTTLVSIPPYVHDFEKWVNEKNFDDNARILLLPPINNQWGVDAYRWGYWSLGPLPRLLTNKTIIVNDTNLKSGENEIISYLYEKIKQGDEKKVASIASSLGISYFLVRDDAIYDSLKDKRAPSSLYEKQLQHMSSIQLIKTFNLWKVYKLDKSPKMNFFSINSLALSDEISDYFDLEKESSYQFVKSEDAKDVLQKLSPFILKFIQGFTCVSCNNQNGEVNAELQKKYLQIFRFSPTVAGMYDVFINLSTLPQDINGKISYPEKITFTDKANGDQKEFNFLEKNLDKSEGKNLVRFSMHLDAGEYNATFFFPQLPNLFTTTKSLTMHINGQERYCSGGDISLFSSDRLYTFTFNRLQENQTATLLIIEDDKQGENVLPDTTLGPRKYSYIYTPMKNSEKSSLFVCGLQSVPAISDLVLKAKLEPRAFLVLKKEMPVQESLLPTVTSTKENATKYTVHIGKSERPFVLVFNERFNKLWRLGSSSVYDTSHFRVNGFANGWIFDKSNGYDLVLEYIPQQKSDQGKLVTTITLVVVVTYFSYWVWKRKKKYE